jgi:cytochrome c peroxidase
MWIGHGRNFLAATLADEYHHLSEKILRMARRLFTNNSKGKCAACHPAPFYLDDRMHDLKVQRYYEPRMSNGKWITAAGPIKTFTLRGIKDSPPYMHDGRLLTLEDTVEFFNIVTELNLTEKEKEALVHFMRQL